MMIVRLLRLISTSFAVVVLTSACKDGVYCSELIWKIYAQGAGIELCKPDPFSDFPLSAPSVKKLIKERYGSTFNLDEPIVSPYALYKSNLLDKIRYSEF